MKKRAIILAGGKGRRLMPFTVVFPKPLMPLGEHPILEVILRQLIESGFEHITMAVNYQSNLIQTFFGDGSKWGVLIDYSIEDKELGTMGPLRLIDDLPENFLVMNGDVLTDLNYAEFYEYHCKKGSLFTISAYTRTVNIDFGVLEINESKETLLGFKEKPTFEYCVSMGVYMLSKEVVSFIPKDTFYGFDQLMLDLLRLNKRPQVKIHDGFWLDIGRPSDYELAVEIFQKEKHKFIK